MLLTSCLDGQSCCCQTVDLCESRFVDGDAALAELCRSVGLALRSRYVLSFGGGHGSRSMETCSSVGQLGC